MYANIYTLSNKYIWREHSIYSAKISVMSYKVALGCKEVFLEAMLKKETD